MGNSFLFFFKMLINRGKLGVHTINIIMKILIPTKVARFVFAAIMAVFGLFHFMNASGMSGMIPDWLPGGVFWVYLTGVALLAAAIALFSNKKARLAMYLLAFMLVIFVLVLHIPAVAGGDQNAMSMVLKDLAIAAGAIAFGNGLDE